MPGGRLSHDERRDIGAGLAKGLGYAEIARRLGRPTSTVSREVARNGGADGYRADRALRATERRARRRGPAPLAARPQEAVDRDELHDFGEQFVAMLVATGLPVWRPACWSGCSSPTPAASPPPTWSGSCGSAPPRSPRPSATSKSWTWSGVSATPGGGASGTSWTTTSGCGPGPATRVPPRTGRTPPGGGRRRRRGHPGRGPARPHGRLLRHPQRRHGERPRRCRGRPDAARRADARGGAGRCRTAGRRARLVGRARHRSPAARRAAAAHPGSTGRPDAVIRHAARHVRPMYPPDVSARPRTVLTGASPKATLIRGQGERYGCGGGSGGGLPDAVRRA